MGEVTGRVAVAAWATASSAAGTGHPVGSAVGEDAGPEQLGDGLERHPPDQLGHVVAAVHEAPAGDPGETGREDHLHRPGPLGAGARPSPAGETVHLVGVEPRGAAVVADGAVEQAPADVGVDGGPLHAETGRHLVGGEEVARSSTLIILKIDFRRQRSDNGA